MAYYIKEGNGKQIFSFLKIVKGIHSKSENKLRIFVEAVWYMAKSGCQWRLLPKVYGNYRSIHRRFKKWCEKKIWEKLLKYTQEPDLEVHIIGGTIVRAHPCSAGYKKNSSNQEALGCSKGGFTTKIHATVDALGNPLKFVLTPGQRNEITQAETLTENVVNSIVVADKGYDSNAFVASLENRKCKAVIPPKRNRKVQRDYDKHLYKERHLIECFFGKIKNFRRIFSRFNKTAEVSMGFLNFVGSLTMASLKFCSQNLGNLPKIKSFLNKKLKCAEETKGEKQSQDTPQAEKTKSEKERNIVQEENIQDKQIVPIRGLFGCNVTNSRKQVTRAPVVVAAMYDNFVWFRSFRLLNFFSTVQFFFQQSPKLSRKQRALAYQSPKETKPNEVIQKNEGETDETAKLSDIGQTKSHTDCFKANRRKKSKKQTKALPEEEKQLAVRQAQNDARVAVIDNQAEHKGKKLDKIFIEVINGYKNQDPETFCNIFNSVFNIVYFQDKQLHEILEPGEALEVLQILERPQPSNNSLLGKEYLQRQVYRKKEQLLKLVSGIPIQQPSSQPENVSHESENPLPNKTTSPSPVTSTTPPANKTAFKPLLKIVFSLKETYFCLLLIAFSISTLCLWHLPLGKVSILKGLVPLEKRESIGLALNIGLPILATLCILSLAYFIYSKYSVESIE